MASTVAVKDDNNQRLQNDFVAQIRKPKIDFLVSTENKNTLDLNMSTTLNFPSTASIECVSLKRKRPPKIQIPSVLREIQPDKIRNKDNMVEDTNVEYFEPGVGVFSMKGKKKNMEDTHKIVSGLNGDPKKVIVYFTV